MPVEEEAEAVPEDLRQAPIPQDAERMRKLRAERLARWRASTVEAYAKVGSRDPKWDAAAQDGLEKVCTSKVIEDHDGDLVEAAWKALEEAVRLGCDDPYVRYVHVQYGNRMHRKRGADGRKELAPAARELAKSKYPAIRRANAAYNANALTPVPKDPGKARDLLRSDEFVAVRDLFQQALRDDPRGAAHDFVEIAGF